MIELYIFFFGTWFLFQYSKKRFNISSLILGLFLLGTIFCGLIFIFFPETVSHPERVSIPAILTHLLFLSLLLIPLVRYGNYLNVEKLNISSQNLRTFSWWIIIPSLLSIILSLNDAISMFGYNDMSSARDVFASGQVESSFVRKYGIIGYFITLGRYTSFISLFLYFYYVFILQSRSPIKILLLISSLSMPIFTLTVAGRDGIFRWSLFFLFCIILFYKYLSWKKHKNFWYTIIILFIAGVSIFSIITKDRFGKNRDGGVVYSVLRYLGEPYYLFSYGYERFGDRPMSDNILDPFPIITQEKRENLSLNKRFRADYYLNTFPTIAGSIEISIGTLKSFILLTILFFFLFFIFQKRGKTSLAKLVGFLFYYEIILMGLFYYMHNDRFTQLSIFFYIIIAYLISNKNKLFYTKA